MTELGLELQAVSIRVRAPRRQRWLGKPAMPAMDRLLVPGLSVTVPTGGVLAVMGASGSGKSSLLLYLAGVLEPPLYGEGVVRCQGVDVSQSAPEHRRMGLMFQDDVLFPHLTVQDNLLLAIPSQSKAPSMVRRADRRSQVDAALADAGLAGLGSRWPHELSGGQRARVALTRTLLAKPRVVLLDEPFSKLDQSLRQRMREHVWQALAQARVPAVLVTHDEGDVPLGAQRVQLPDQPSMS